MRSLPNGRFAAWQCLVLSLMLLIAPRTGAWLSSPATKRTTVVWQSNNLSGNRKFSQTSLSAGNGVLDFVKGLDSSLGNPSGSDAAAEAYSAPAPALSSSVTALKSSGGAMDMSIPNEVILAGGGLALLAFLGFAYYLVTKKPDTNTNPGASSLNDSFGIEEVAPLPKGVVDENALSQQLEAAETKFQEETIGDGSSGNLLSKLKSRLTKETILREETETKLQSTAQELSENKVLLVSETGLRKELESSLATASATNEGLTEDLATQEQVLLETTDKWNFAKIKLDEETKLKEEVVGELEQAAELNRSLEDKYELEQNALRKTKTNLDTTQSALDDTQTRLSRTQKELIRSNSDLMSTKEVLSETTGDLASLEEEQRSLRTLSKKMWRLSKSRVSNRVRSVGDRLRGRGRK